MNDRDPARASDGGPDEAGRTAFDWPGDAGTTAAVLRELDVQVRLRRRRQRRLRVACSVVAVALAGAWFWRGETAVVSTPVAQTAPSVSTPTTRVLPDNSVVVLRDGAELEVAFDAAARRVRLVRGEAIFEVAKDPARPFVVRAGAVDVRAVGTAFAVSLQQAAVEVLVTEGEVAVERSPRPAGPAEAPEPAIASAGGDPREAAPVALVAGKCLVIDVSAPAVAPQLRALTQAEIEDRLGWRVPTLRFSRTPLREAVAMINQHSRVRLVLDAAAPGDVPLSGAIQADNIEPLLELLALDHGIRAEPRGAREIVLRPAR